MCSLLIGLWILGGGGEGGENDRSCFLLCRFGQPQLCGSSIAIQEALSWNFEKPFDFPEYHTNAQC